MGFLTESERQTLAAICDTLIPRLDNSSAVAEYSAADGNVVDRLEDAYEATISDDARTELRLLLRAFNMGGFNALLGGSWQPFAQMPLHEREHLLRDWGTSRLALRRKAFQAFKRLTLFLGYANLPNSPTHPIWDTIRYPGPPGGNEDIPRSITPTPITDGRTLTCDVLVVGSGAGGGVVAGELSAAGYDVLVVEKGGYHAEADFTGNERAASETLFERNAALTTKDTAMMVLAGSTLGGGTTVNWSASFRTPDHVLREWANEYGITAATGDDWQRSLDAVSERMHVNCDESHVNANNACLERGLQALGYHVDVIPRNVNGCEECGFCNYGCAFGAKQGTMKTYLQDAYNRGARIVVHAEVKRVMHSRGRVSGATVEVTADDGTVHLLTVKADCVVVSAGTIHTPAILKRSGLRNSNIGEHLHLHPTTAIFSLFDEPVRQWEGVPMSRVSKEFSDLDGRGYGTALEVAPSHPGLIAATIPWVSAAQHKRIIGQLETMANIIAITRDSYGGRVTVDRYGNPVLEYELHPYDHRHVMRGVLESLKVHYAAGAREIYSPYNDMLSFRNDGQSRSDSEFVRFLRQVEDRGLKPHSYPLFSAHQMSSCRMAASRTQGALKPTGETWEIENLFVADGSAMPTATGVNPMVSIMGTAHHIAQHIKDALA